MKMKFQKLRYFCKCKECDEKAFVDDTIILLNKEQPQYNYYCPYCGEHGYVDCDDVTVEVIIQ